MPVRLRLPLVLLVCLVATGALSFVLWEREQRDARVDARE